MKNLLFLLVLFSCATAKEPVEYKDVLVRYVRTETEKRWEGNQLREKRLYVYVDEYNEEHWLESKHDSLFIMPFRR